MDLQDPFIKKYAEERVGMYSEYRVTGNMSVSRAFGDPDYKLGHGCPDPTKYMWAWPKGHSKVFTADLIIATPEIEYLELTSEDLFLVVGCDGLWDVIDDKLATRIVLQEIEKYGRGPEGAKSAAEELQKLAYRLNYCLLICQ